MRRYILAICLLVAAAGAVVTAGPQDNCTKDCAASLKACLSQTPATDKKQEEARRNSCYDRDTACRKSCGPSRSPN
jgi:hypothetical protein